MNSLPTPHAPWTTSEDWAWLGGDKTSEKGVSVEEQGPCTVEKGTPLPKFLFWSHQKIFPLECEAPKGKIKLTVIFFSCFRVVVCSDQGGGRVHTPCWVFFFTAIQKKSLPWAEKMKEFTLEHKKCPDLGTWGWGLYSSRLRGRNSPHRTPHGRGFPYIHCASRVIEKAV